MDYASGTPIRKDVLMEMLPYFSKIFFNPGAIYQEGFDIIDILNKTRAEVAKMISARPKEIIFTDGGTEANNLVLRGIVSQWRNKNDDKKPHIITSSIEHASILETCHDLEEKNIADITYISVDEFGILDIKELKKSIQVNTILVSIGYVNGEIGVIQNIKSISKLIRYYRKHNNSKLPYFHTDAVQAVNFLDINIQRLGVDFMTVNGSKIYGPKKIAFLFKKADIKIDSIITGGSQEFGLRAGTENIPYIVGLSKALSVVSEEKESEMLRLRKLQMYMEDLLKKEISHLFIINGEKSNRVPNILSISIPKLSSEEIVLRLDTVGIKVSVKSACKSGEYGDSHVIKALRKKDTQSIRFSFGNTTTKKDIRYVVEKLVKIINSMNRTYKKYL